MDGFLGSKIRVPPYIRRLFTRLMAVGPSLIVALVKGEDGVNALLVFSQVVLSLQLPFAVFPLVLFTNDKDFMTIQFKGNDDAGEEVILKRSYENNRYKNSRITVINNLSFSIEWLKSLPYLLQL